MAWKETERAKAVQIRRLYRCDDCQHEFRFVHCDEDDLTHPECPMCVVNRLPEAPVPRVDWVPPLVGRRSSISDAVDATHKMSEEMGLTDMNDHARPGDIAFKGPPPVQTAERETMMRDLVQAGVPQETATEMTNPVSNYWQGNMGGAAESTVGNQSVAAAASAEAKAQGVDPIGMLERARETGTLRPQYDVIAGGKM